MRADLPDWAEGLFRKARYKSIRGGRGSAKSWTVATALLAKGAMGRERILCAREFQVSIRDSVHKLLADRIAALGLGDFYTVTQNQILGMNGTEFMFAGLRHSINSIKSTEGVTIAWVEEAQVVSEESWSILIPTIRVDGSEIWLTWNPDLDSDPTHRRFVDGPPPDCMSVVVNWDHNPWFSQEMRDEKDHLYRVDPEAADHVWGGKTRRNSVAQVLRGRYVVESFTPEKDWHGPYQGADWGFSVDATALVRCWVYERTLYVEHEAYGIGIDLDDTPKLFDGVPKAREYVTRADSSRPETISHMRRHGYTRTIGAYKWQGSVEDGVEHLRSYERIVIHPRCTHAAEEARLWSYKVDKLSGDVKPELLDKHNHVWDAVRYALEPVIRAGKPLARKAPEPKRRHDYGGKKRDGKGWKTA